MRAWRALKAVGAAVLRDGVYLLPLSEDGTSRLLAVAEDVRHHGGSAHLLCTAAPEGESFEDLFDRSVEFGQLVEEIRQTQTHLTMSNASKAVRKLRKSLAQLIEIDHFPGPAQVQACAAMQDLELVAEQLLGLGEPTSGLGALSLLQRSDHEGRVWFTRSHPWVDRLASAWLIRRAIDPKARILWLDALEQAPPGALGFDIDGGAFSHVGAKVTFEVLVTRFGLTTPALSRLGAIVHYLDVGGICPTEAPGIEQILAGLRAVSDSDDQLLARATPIFEALLLAFEKELLP
ncbi:MAG: chromate resistance protein ChrB domain-containing protein [Leptothrix ochracea]|uniref:chromate resistance protein ChrB domain-containing protein n=1 Tax=Leptothrix ochracea TaxID=735331 RepID=UPI0034E2835F